MASPVLVHGYKVGSVVKINIDPKDFSKILVAIDVKDQIKIPKDSKAIISNMGLVSGKGVIIDINGQCDGDDCAQSGDYLQGEVLSMLGSMLPKNELDDYFQQIKKGVYSVMDTLQGDSANNQTIQNSKDILTNLVSITSHLEKILSQNERNLQLSVNNIEEFSSALKENNDDLNKIINDVASITGDLKASNIDSLLIVTKGAVSGLQENLVNLESVLKKTDNTFNNIDGVVKGINEGKGSLGKLIKDDELYDELNLTAKHTNLLLQDMRLFPGRYFNISLLKSKAKDYEKVEDDPGLQE
ncbi:MAG: MlaD family protein [Saprospiraceae bacterium]